MDNQKRIEWTHQKLEEFETFRHDWWQFQYKTKEPGKELQFPLSFRDYLEFFAQKVWIDDPL